MEPMELIHAAEEQAQKIRTDAAGEAKKLLADAEKAGQAAIENAKARAAQTQQQMRQKAQEQADAESKTAAEAAAQQAAALRDTAKAHMPEAAKLIAERIVNG